MRGKNEMQLVKTQDHRNFQLNCIQRQLKETCGIRLIYVLGGRRQVWSGYLTILVPASHTFTFEDIAGRKLRRRAHGCQE